MEGPSKSEEIPGASVEPDHEQESRQLDDAIPEPFAEGTETFSSSLGPGGDRGYRPAKVIEVNIDRPLTALKGLDGYEFVQLIVRLHGVPLGTVRVPIRNGNCDAHTMADAIVKNLGSRVVIHLIEDLLAIGIQPGSSDPQTLLSTQHSEQKRALPSMTVAVCTRDREERLMDCLASIDNLNYPGSLEVIVVDNAPARGDTAALIRAGWPHFRYVREDRPGLDWARNRAIEESRSEVVAFTDDDVIVDPGWASSLGRAFSEDASLAAVTGLVVPFELRTKAQAIFESYGGFTKGFVRRWYRAGPGSSAHIGSGRYGTGANMAFRRSVFGDIGAFDPALDVGTVTNGGGDLEMFFRILQEGYALSYEPSAMVRHRHRPDYQSLRTQITNNGVGSYAAFVRSGLAYPAQRRKIALFGLAWLGQWSLRRLAKSFMRPSRFPRDLIVAELKGSLVGLARYPAARRRAQEISGKHGAELPALQNRDRSKRRTLGGTAVHAVDAQTPLGDLTDVTGHERTRAYVQCGPRLLGAVEIPNLGDPISAAQLRAAVAGELCSDLLGVLFNLDRPFVWGGILHALKEQLAPSGAEQPAEQLLGPHVSASIVVATLDRPNDLRTCIESLRAQKTARRVDIVVVDNNPASGETAKVVTEFPDVILVREERRGLSYARNAGIRASAGDIIVMTDDDANAPEDWLEKLLAPFARPDVASVTGNVLPLELSTASQRLFESYGGLGRGFEVKEVDDRWLETSRLAAPTWRLGATANAAFRASVFKDQDIGLMHEALGAGMPAAVGEDTYLFYKILKAGHTLVYEPSAYLWHRHRPDMASFRSQIYGYSKGHVAYHLTTLVQDRDLRALPYLLLRLPMGHIRSSARWLKGDRTYPLSLSLLELRGQLLGPAAFVQSRHRVRRNRSAAQTATSPGEQECEEA